MNKMWFVLLLGVGIVVGGNGVASFVAPELTFNEKFKAVCMPNNTHGLPDGFIQPSQLAPVQQSGLRPGLTFGSCALGACGLVLFSFWLIRSGVLDSWEHLEHLFSGLDLGYGTIPLYQAQKIEESNLNEKQTLGVLDQFKQAIAKPLPLVPKCWWFIEQHRSGEDQVVLYSDPISGITIFGVCDGHSGPLLSDNIENQTWIKHAQTECGGVLPVLIANQFPTALIKDLQKVDLMSDEAIKNAVQKSFEEFNNTKIKEWNSQMGEILNKIWERGKKDKEYIYRRDCFNGGGSTCALCIYLSKQQKVITVHCGDSVIFVVDKNGSIIRTEGHNYDHPGEQKRPACHWQKKRLRGELVVSRSLGDFEYTEYGLISTPEVTVYDANPLKYCFVSSDGFTDGLVQKFEQINAPLKGERASLENAFLQKLLENDCYKNAQKSSQAIKELFFAQGGRPILGSTWGNGCENDDASCILMHF